MRLVFVYFLEYQYIYTYIHLNLNEPLSYLMGREKIGHRERNVGHVESDHKNGEQLTLHILPKTTNVFLAFYLNNSSVYLLGCRIAK